MEKALKKMEKDQKEKSKRGSKRSAVGDEPQQKTTSEEQKQREELEEMVRLGAKLEDVTAAAKKAVKEPTRLILTKLSSVEKSSRINAMKQKLEELKATEGQDHRDDGEQLKVLGLQAAMQVAQREGSLVEKKKSGQTSRDARANASADVRKLGKHLLK